jgi:hypothetical protein
MTSEGRGFPIPAIELVRQLEEIVLLMLAPPTELEDWATAHRMP